MPPHSMGSGTISFGLVSIPVRMYTAAGSAGVSFNLLHAKCGNRIKQQQVCPVCNEVLDRSALVRGYEFAKDQYVRFTEEELKTFEEENSKMIEIEEMKVEGKEITTVAPQAERAQVIDLMDALKQSLEQRGAAKGGAERKPAAKAKAAAEAAPKKKAAGRK